MTSNLKMPFKFTCVDVMLSEYLYAYIFMANYTGQRSFSQPKRIKNDKRTTMSVKPALLGSVKLREINFDYIIIIAGFAVHKSL